MELGDGYADSSAESASTPRPSSLSDSPSPPAELSAWNEIPPEALIRGDSFHDEGRMIFWLPLTHSEKLDPKLITKKSFVVRNLGLRQGGTHLPLKLNSFYSGNPTKSPHIFFGSNGFRAFRSTGASRWNAWGFGRSILRGLVQHGQDMIATLKRFVGGQ